MKNNQLVPAMAFYHRNGFAPAWKQAMLFAGEGGRIATLPDIIAARIATIHGSTAWNTWFSTTTAEYLGRSRGGTKIIIVAHGIGPLATIEGILDAYSSPRKNGNPNDNSGRISRENFLKLESGDYGSVVILDINQVLRSTGNPFNHCMKRKEAEKNPLVQARLGNRWEKYLEEHQKFDQEYFLKNFPETDRDEPLITMTGANWYYDLEQSLWPLKDNQALASLLWIEGVNRTHGGSSVHGSIACDVKYKDWGAAKFIAIRAGQWNKEIRECGYDGPGKLIRHNWQSLLRSCHKEDVGFRVLLKIGDRWFTQYLKQGTSEDTNEPEFLVKAVEWVGTTKKFTTKTGRYNIEDIQKIAPPRANAYSIISVKEQYNPRHYRRTIQFFRVNVDNSKRLIREDDLCSEHEALLRLVKK